MIGSVPPAFMQAEVDYRIERIKNGYQPKTRSSVRRGRFASFLSRSRSRSRRPVANPAAVAAQTLPLGAPYHLAGRS
jgi:hypothetical protein